MRILTLYKGIFAFFVHTLCILNRKPKCQTVKEIRIYVHTRSVYKIYFNIIFQTDAENCNLPVYYRNLTSASPHADAATSRFTTFRGTASEVENRMSRLTYAGCGQISTFAQLHLGEAWYRRHRSRHHLYLVWHRHHHRQLCRR